jgi:hypothetical protein
VKENCPLFGQFYYVLKYNLGANENKLGINLRGAIYFTRNIIRIFGLILKELLRTEKCSQCICSMSQYTIGMGENSAPYVLKRIHHVMNNATFPSFNLKAKQVSCLESLLLKQDVIAVFPTGYGKSFIFHALPDLFPQKMTGFENIVMVVCPLNSIVKDQINVLMSRGI